MNAEKKIVVAGATIIALIVVTLILMIVFATVNQNEKRKISFSMDNSITNQTQPIESAEPKNEVENETGSKEKPEKIITGEITMQEISEGKILPIPPTFKYLEGEYDSGAVIQDKDKNEFVWIPIDEKNTYSRWMFESSDQISKEDLEELNLKDINSYNIEFDASVEKYGGFYVARYEAGKESGKNIPVSKANVLPWTKIIWSKAKQLSTEMYQENDYFETDLINSYAWDSICNWLENSGKNVNDSTEYGNYQNSRDGLNRIVETGSNEKWKINNIYDMAGNAWEYTTEEYGQHEKYHIGRGGGYWNEGNLYPISTRGTSDDNADINIGFRVVMYLK